MFTRSFSVGKSEKEERKFYSVRDVSYFAHLTLEKPLQDASINGLFILVLFFWLDGVASADN